jgi:hypothetical protein
VTPTEITQYLTVGVLFLSTIFIPEYLRRRRLGTATERQSEASWQSLTKAYQEERDSLQKRLDSRDKVYAEQLRLVEADFENKVHDLEATIAELRTEVRILRRRD